MGERPRDMPYQKVGAARLNDKTLNAILDQIRRGGVCRPQYRQTTGEGFQQDLPKAFTHRRKNKEICRLIRGNELLRANRRTDCYLFSKTGEYMKIIHDSAANCEVDIFSLEHA